MSWSTRESLQRTAFKQTYPATSTPGTPSTRNGCEGVVSGAQRAGLPVRNRVYVHVRIDFEVHMDGVRSGGILSPIPHPTGLAFCILVVFYIRLLVEARPFPCLFSVRSPPVCLVEFVQCAKLLEGHTGIELGYQAQRGKSGKF